MHFLNAHAYSGVTIEKLKNETGFELIILKKVLVTTATQEELNALQEEIYHTLPKRLLAELSKIKRKPGG